MPNFVKKYFYLYLILLMCVGGFLVPRVGFSALPPEESGTTVSLEIEEKIPEPIPTVGVLAPLPPGKLILRGLASPSAFLSILKNKTLSATKGLSEDGSFEVLLTDISPGVYELSFFVEDVEDNISESIVLSSVSVTSRTVTTIEDIFIPPTLVLDTPEVSEDEEIKIHGFTAPEATVTVFFPPSDISKQTTSESNGRFEISFPANELPEAEYTIKANAQLAPGIISNFSIGLKLRVGPPITPPTIPPSIPPPITPPPMPPGMECFFVDLNCDEKIELIDLSILLYNWGVPEDKKVDFNKDGPVDLIDFSIMMFWWTI